MNTVIWFACGSGSFAFAVRGEEVHLFDPQLKLVPGWYRIVGKGERAAQSGNLYPEYLVELRPGVELWEGNAVSLVLQRVPDGQLIHMSSVRTWEELAVPHDIVRQMFPRVGEQLDATAAFHMS